MSSTPTPLNMRERAEAIVKTQIHDGSIVQSYLEFIEMIEQALFQAEQDGFERGVRTSTQAIEDICYSHDERMNAQHQELLEDDGAQQAKLQVLGLLPPREKSRIEREGK